MAAFSALATSRIFSTKLKFLTHSGKGQNRHQDNGDCLERFSSFSLFSWFIVCTLRNLAGSQLDRAVVDGIETLAQMSGGLDKKGTWHIGAKVFLKLDAIGYICGMLAGRLQFWSVHHWIKILRQDASMSEIETNDVTSASQRHIEISQDRFWLLKLIPT